MAIIAALPMVIAFWQFRQTNWIPARRAFSAANANDFSWRNRVASWNGALQIIAEHPWLGAGWGRPESLYEHYYLPARLEEGAAIQMNDYFTLAATLGIPALVYFAMYLGLTAVESRRFPRSEAQPAQLGSKTPTLQSWKPASLAGAAALLIGFWFDGGLFALAIAIAFWVLIEMGVPKMDIKTLSLSKGPFSTRWVEGS
ncbi:MAG TPA: O-antigen ligase family protein [Verrucomicrobiae bacterium]|nr:O-antigen ligase family protein [Verrucomicrobiae bacterium]